jgi:hypothetical protein
LATDQRYCLNCGARRTGPRVAFRQHLFSGAPSSQNGAPAAPAAARAWSPLAAVVVLGLLGVMLLVGVLIGKDDNNQQTTATVQGTAPAAAPAPTTATAAIPPPTPPAATTPPAVTTPPAAEGEAPASGTGAGTKGATKVAPNGK